MITVPSQKMQTQFSEFADIAQHREPVIITQYNRPTLVLLRYEDNIENMRLAAKMRFIQRLNEDARHATEPTDEELEELNRLIDEEREMIYQERLANHAK